jgi:hypothetical protein
MQPDTSDIVGEFNLQPQDGGAYVDILNLFAAPSNTWTLEALLQPPQETRLAGKAYGLKYNYYLEYTPFFSTHTAGVNFSNVTLDRFAIPQANSNGLVYYADTFEQWTTFTNADGTTVSAPFGWGNPVATDPNYASKGWRLAPRGLTAFSVSANEFASPFIEHTDFSQARNLGATNVTDSITTIRVGTDATEGTVQVFSKNQSDANYKGAFDELFLGQQESAGTGSGNSIVPGTLLTSLKDSVYYRASMSVKMASGNPLGKSPQIVLRVGTPNAGWGGNLEINETSGAGPSPTEWTNYVAWVRGMPAYNGALQQNLTLKVQVADTNLLQGLGGSAGDNAVGGTVCIDTMSLEMFPVAFFN